MEKSEKEKQRKVDKQEKKREKEEHGRHISEMRPVTEEAYGGGMYGTEEGKREKRAGPPASETQSADGPSEVLPEPKHKPPPSTGDLDLDVTGQSYIQ